jgi:hypothetical protein
MNCKPGDVAYLTQDLFIQCRGCGEKALLVKRGTVVTVERLGGPAWWFIADPIPFAVRTSCGAEARDTITGFDDYLLRPFRAEGVTPDEVRELYAPRLPEHA